MMLEESELLVCPWAAEAGGAGRPGGAKRLIRAPAGGRFLGFARAPATASSWWSWLSRQTVQVFETEDASLLMTVYRPRGLRRTWLIHDAEERRVGYFYRHILWEAGGSRLGLLQHTSEGAGRFAGPAGDALASFTIQPDTSVLLAFSPVLSGKPFTRMILLADVLSW